MNLVQSGSGLSGMMEFLGWNLIFSGYITEASGVAGEAASGSQSFDVRLDFANPVLTGVVASGSFLDPNLMITKRYNLTVPLRRLTE